MLRNGYGIWYLTSGHSLLNFLLLLLLYATAGSDLPSSSSKWHKTLWQTLSMTALFAIWTGRCHNVYGDTPSDYVGKFIVNIRRIKKLAIRALPKLRGLRFL